MFIKKLELQGFKTFADKTTVEFKPESKITVIVGPNGCGKSNLLDAMRWVLGEQSVKLLRGTTQEEIIFAGSNDRKPTSMAEAELTIDNASGKIKMDFSEISIKRKLYRSGESEYFINKEQVRLKDIQNLFLDTGLGKGSYSIIGQGQVEQVLTSKPIDRRSIFEEAAGINQYKSRKVATLRKLEQTHQNLLRLQDLRSEIHGLLGPLEIQAGKAQEYNDLKNQLSEMEIGLYKEQIEKGRARGIELEAKIAEIKGQLEKLRTENVNIDQKRDEYKTQIKALEEKIEAYRQESSQTRGKMELAQSEIKVSQEREAAQKERLEQIAIEKENIQKNIEALEASLVSAGEDNKASEMALSEMEASFTQKDEETRTHFEKWQSLSDDIEKLRKLLLGIDDELTRERHMQVDLKSQEKYFQEDLLTLKNRLQKSEENQIETDSRLKEAQNKKQELVSKQSQLARNRETLFSTRSQKEEMRRKLLEQKQLLKQSFDSKTARLSLLKEMQSNYEGFDRGVKAMLIAKKDQPSEFGSILGVMADLIDSPKEYETAVEVGLSGLLQAIVVPTTQDAKKCIRYLKDNGLGRVTFIPLDQVFDEKALPQSLAEKVKPKNSVMQKLINYLLGPILVSQDIDNAFNNIAKLSRSGFLKIVTLAGEEFLLGGMITGGASKQVSSTLLGRSREVTELEKDVAQLTRELDQKTVEEKQTQAELEEAQHGLEALGNEVHLIEVEQGSLANDEARLKIEITKIQNEITDNKEQIANKKKNLDEVTAAQKTKQGLIDTKMGERNVQQKQLDAKEEEFKNFLAEKEQANQVLTEMRLKLATAKANLRQVQIKIQNINESISEQKRQYSHRDEEMERLTLKLQEATQKVAQTHEQLPLLSQVFEDFNQKLRDAQLERERFQNDLEVLERTIRNASEVERDFRQKLSVEEINQAKTNAELDTIRQLLATEYDITLDDVLKVPGVQGNYEEVKETVENLRRKMKRLGPVNLLAIDEFAAQKERLAFIEKQCGDLEKAKEDLYQLIKELDQLAEKSFKETFYSIKKNFEQIFTQLFRGGEAELSLTESTNVLEAGVDIYAQPPGKKRQNLMLLSGGEKALTAIALLFAIMNVNPAPFIILDEIDAALDDANNVRFAEMLAQFASQSHFMVITHKKPTMSVAGSIYGVTMQTSGVSKLLSMSLQKASQN